MAATADTNIIVKPTPGMTPQEARDVRARAWHFVFDCYAKKKAARPGGPDDAERRSNELGATGKSSK